VATQAAFLFVFQAFRLKAATSARTAWAGSDRAPLRKASVGGAKALGGESWKTLISVRAYHTFSGEREALKTPTIRRLIPDAATNFRGWLLVGRLAH
jgi:hypothetical protein